MAHRLNFIGINSDHHKLEILNHIIYQSKTNFFVLDMKIYAESDIFSISLGLRDENESISTLEYLQLFRNTIIQYFKEEGIKYFSSEELYCQSPLIEDLSTCMHSCPYKLNDAYPMNCRGLKRVSS